MRPELERIQLLDDYLHQRLSPAQAADLEVRLLIEPGLYDELEAQKQVYGLLQTRGRQQLRRELEQIHQRLYERTALSWLVYALVGLVAVMVSCWILL
jgi:hypothetical protein